MLTLSISTKASPQVSAPLLNADDQDTKIEAARVNKLFLDPEMTISEWSASYERSVIKLCKAMLIIQDTPSVLVNSISSWRVLADLARARSVALQKVAEQAFGDPATQAMSLSKDYASLTERLESQLHVAESEGSFWDRASIIQEADLFWYHYCEFEKDLTERTIDTIREHYWTANAVVVGAVGLYGARRFWNERAARLERAHRAEVIRQKVDAALRTFKAVRDTIEPHRNEHSKPFVEASSEVSPLARGTQLLELELREDVSTRSQGMIEIEPRRKKEKRSKGKEPEKTMKPADAQKELGGGLAAAAYSETFQHWVEGLGEGQRRIVESRMRDIRSGHPGDTRAVGDGLMEMRFVNGLRIYYFINGSPTTIYFISGGDKSSSRQQDKDIEDGKNVVRLIKEDLIHK